MENNLFYAGWRHPAGTGWLAGGTRLERETAAREAWRTLGSNISAPGRRRPGRVRIRRAFPFQLVFLLLVYLLSLIGPPRLDWAIYLFVYFCFCMYFSQLFLTFNVLFGITFLMDFHVWGIPFRA